MFRESVNNGQGGLVVLHDMSLAAKFVDRVVLMKAGEIVADGEVSYVMTSQRLAEVFQIRASVNGTHVTIDGAL